MYCGTATAATADHVFARQFFLIEHRDQLPKVPACSDCNNRKSQLEHYLATILPFGGRHRHSRRMLDEMVPPRLARNRKLHADIRSSLKPIWSNEGGYAIRTSGIALDPDKLLRLLDYVVEDLSGTIGKFDLERLIK